MSDDRPVLNYASPQSSAAEWKTVWTCRDNFEANLAVATLQERGLHARVDNENINVMASYLGSAVAPKVQVPLADVEAARAILKEIDHEREKRQEAATMHCPACGTPRAKRRVPIVRHIASGLLIASIVLIALDVGAVVVVTLPLVVLMWLWPLTPRWRCIKCGHRWNAPEPDAPDEDEDV